MSGAGTDVLCNGGTTGIIMVQATSGTAPYTFAITPAGTQSNPTADSAVFTGLCSRYVYSNRNGRRRLHSRNRCNGDGTKGPGHDYEQHRLNLQR
nr:SprB repeat-containing protein [Bacteroidota bacterium]